METCLDSSTIHDDWRLNLNGYKLNSAGNGSNNKRAAVCPDFKEFLTSMVWGALPHSKSHLNFDTKIHFEKKKKKENNTKLGIVFHKNEMGKRTRQILFLSYPHHHIIVSVLMIFLCFFS